MNLGAALMSPSVLCPDLRVEPPKRGSGVPPLGEMRGVLREIVVQAQQGGGVVAAEAEKDEAPVNPPGLEAVKSEEVGTVREATLEVKAVEVEVGLKKHVGPAPISTVDNKGGVTVEEEKTPVSTPPKAKAKPSALQSGNKNANASTPLKNGNKSNTPTPSSTPTPAFKGTSKKTTTPVSTPPKKALPRAMLETVRRKPNMEIRVKEETPAYSTASRTVDDEDQNYGHPNQKQSQPPSTAGTGNVSSSRPGMRSVLPVPQPRTVAPSNGAAASGQQAPVTATPGVLRRLPTIPPPQQPASAEPQSTVVRAATPPTTTTTPTVHTANSIGNNLGKVSVKASTSSSNLAGLAGLRQAHSQVKLPWSAASAVLSPPPSSSSASSVGMGSAGLGGLMSPEMTPGGQTIVFYGSRPMSAVRSPMGPRLRAAGPRVSTPSGLGRKPPGLQL